MAFEAILSEQRAKPKGWRRATFVVSVALHVAALLAGVVHSLWQVDDGLVLNLLPVWAPDAAVRKKILVDNPARLYEF